MDERDGRRGLSELWSRYKDTVFRTASARDKCLATAIRRIARSVLRSGQAFSSSERCILAEANRIRQTTPAGDQLDRETLAALVSRRVCQAVLSRASPEPTRSSRTEDTVRQRCLATVALSN